MIHTNAGTEKKIRIVYIQVSLYMDITYNLNITRSHDRRYFYIVLSGCLEIKQIKQQSPSLAESIAETQSIT